MQLVTTASCSREIVEKDADADCGYKVILIEKIGKEQITTGIEDVITESDESVVVFATEGAIVVNGKEPMNVEIYDPVGHLVKKIFIEDCDTIEMPRGYYIVKIGDIVKKVVVKRI